MKPLIIINYKLYRQSSGNNATALTKSLSKVHSSQYTIAYAPSILTCREIKRATNLHIFAQHVHPITFGAHTGHISITELKQSSITGVILNHSEKKIPYSQLKATITACQKHKIQTIVCASTLKKISAIVPLKPTYLAYEPTELIGNNIAVTDAHPQIITKALSLLQKPTRLLVGAGIHNNKDIKHALKLGAGGVLVSHKITCARNPQQALRKLLKEQ